MAYEERAQVEIDVGGQQITLFERRPGDFSGPDGGGPDPRIIETIRQQLETQRLASLSRATSERPKDEVR